MLSSNGKLLASLLRMKYGADVKGVGPDVTQLITLWGNHSKEGLRPVVDELENKGFITVDKGTGTSTPEIKAYNLKNIVGITIQEPMQAYLDNSE
ncbi:MAG: hypothetical protein QNK31_12735 [Porticoccus sp.]|nr:hypothetical protein [Porticoccus sp.]